MEPTTALTSPEFRNLLDQCVHCGLCLPACPTYAELQTEMDSPRGRIQLMHAAADGRIDTSGAFAEHIELCLGCRACETACPSGVQYGLLFETARAAIAEKPTTTPLERGVRWLALRQMLPHRDRLRFVARLMRLYQATGLSNLVRKMSFLPPGLRAMENLLPPLSLRFPNYSKPAPAIGEKRGTVAFLYGCVQDAFLTDVNTATVRVLQRNGYEVHFPQTQTCCGAAALHIGESQLARDLARQNIDAFGNRAYDAIINNAGGCGATLKEYGHLLADDPAYVEKAKQFVAKLEDINEFLADHLHSPPTGKLNVRVTYVDSCHLRHGQKVVRQPRQLLKAIPGITLVELQKPDMCCGSAGVYNIMQTETAEQVLDAKMVDVAGTRADMIVTTNTGCHMQLIHGVRKKGLKAEVVHLVELLDRSYQVGSTRAR
jgi:glycolate oxidase iron-sulfur subunit